MNLQKFGPFTVYWQEANILGRAKLHFSASSFSIDFKDSHPSLEDINQHLLAATDFYLQKKIELLKSEH